MLGDGINEIFPNGVRAGPEDIPGKAIVTVDDAGGLLMRRTNTRTSVWMVSVNASAGSPVDVVIPEPPVPVCVEDVVIIVFVMVPTDARTPLYL